MQNTYKLYEAFGELIYVIAMADGKIQEEELEVIEKRLSQHPWGKDMKWSFDYEVKKGRDLDELYKKVIYYCETHGPDEEYDFLISVLEEIAKSSAGIDADEQEVMDSFVNDLCKKFSEDISRINTL